MDARLHGRKCFVAATAASAAPDDTSHRKSHERIGFAWEPGDVHGHHYKHNGHCRQLERQWRAGRKCRLGNNHFADIYFNPSDSNSAYATPQALAANPKAYDLESLLTHELGHFFGFSHSAVWSAIMFPFAPAPGTFGGMRPTSQQPDAPLGEDDRTGLRVLYPDPADTLHQGSITGRISPANPLALPASPSGVTGIFGAQMVVVDAASGAVVGATLDWWSCTIPAPAQFDGVV